MENGASNLSEEEAKLYDRQLRLWGVASQNRIRNSRVLCVGADGLAAEVVKNIVLSGIGHLTLMDEAMVAVSDLGSNFFLRDNHIGQNRAECSLDGIRQLNPNVDIVGDTRSLPQLTADFVQTFDIVVVTSRVKEDQIFLSKLCFASLGEKAQKKKRKVALFAAECLGWFAYYYSCLDEHAYVVKRTVKKEDGSETNEEKKYTTPKWKGGKDLKVTKKSFEFPSLTDVYAMDVTAVQQAFGRRLKDVAATHCCIQLVHNFRSDHKRFPTENDLETLMKTRAAMVNGVSTDVDTVMPLSTLEPLVSACSALFNPVCAVFGGLLASEILKIISAKDKPWENCMIYNSLSSNSVCKSVFPTT